MSIHAPVNAFPVQCLGTDSIEVLHYRQAGDSDIIQFCFLKFSCKQFHAGWSHAFHGKVELKGQGHQHFLGTWTRPEECCMPSTNTVAFIVCEKNLTAQDQDQDQDSLLVKRRNDNHSPGPVIRELVPSSNQRSELSNTILCIFSGWDQRIGEGIPIPDSLGEEATFINICIGNGSLKCHRVLIPTTPSFGDKVIC